MTNLKELELSSLCNVIREDKKKDKNKKDDISIMIGL